MPRRIEHDLRVNFLYVGKPRELALNVRPQHVTHPAAGGGHRHLDVDSVPSVFARLNSAGINESEIHDVDWYFGIEDCFQLIDHHLFG